MHSLILPKGQAVVENMQASCVHMINMLRSLEETGFSGYLELQVEDSKGIVFFGKGEVINSLFVDGEKQEKITGQEAFSLILDQSNSKDGIINQYRFNTNIIKVFATMASNEVVFNNLSTDFISLEKIIPDLGRKGLTGYLELKMANKKQMAVIFFEEGKPVECLFSSLKTGNMRSGLKILNSVVKHASEVGAVFNVYRASMHSAQEKKMAVPSSDREKVMEFLEVSFDIINSVFSSHLGENGFEHVFADMCIEVTDEYPFMHPFADVIVYRDGHLKVDSEAEMIQVLEGVNECLRRVFEKVTSTTGNVLPEVKTRIVDAMGEERQKLIRWQIDKHIPVLFEGG